MMKHATVRITGAGSELPPDVITTAEVEERSAAGREICLTCRDATMSLPAA